MIDQIVNDVWSTWLRRSWTHLDLQDERLGLPSDNVVGPVLQYLSVMILIHIFWSLDRVWRFPCI